MSKTPDSPVTPIDMVDVTFIMKTGMHNLVGEQGYYSEFLRDRHTSYRHYETVDLPGGFETNSVELGKRTQLLVIDCLMECGNREFQENNGLTTGLKVAEEIRERNPDLPIWLLDPPNDEYEDDVVLRVGRANIDIVHLYETKPSVFADRVEELLGKKS